MLAHEDVVQGEQHQRRDDRDRNLGMPERLRHQRRRKAVEQAADGGGGSGRDIPTDGQETRPRGKRQGKGGEQVVADHRAEPERQRREDERRQWKETAPGQVGSGWIVEVVRQQRIQTVTDGIGDPAQKPD